MKKYKFLVLLLIFAGISCSSPSNIDEDEAATIVLTEPPIVTGIILTDITGRHFGYWGQPSYSEDNIGNGTVYIAPNPFSSVTSIAFSLLKESCVKVLIARARLARTLESVSVGGAILPSSKEIIVAEWDRGMMAAGNNIFRWDGADKNGNPLPAGFYRVYVIVGSEIHWNDLFLSRVPDDIPPGMRFR